MSDVIKVLNFSTIPAKANIYLLKLFLRNLLNIRVIETELHESFKLYLFNNLMCDLSSQKPQISWFHVFVQL